MRAVGVIPARYASSRFPGKPLADLRGRPLVQHVYERARRSKTLARVVVATDDLRIRDAVVAFGGEVQLTGLHHPSGTDRVAEVAASLSCEIVVNIQGDEPLIEPPMIDEAVSPFFVESDLIMGTVCRRLEKEEEWQSPHVVKVVRDRRGFALYFSRTPIPYARVQGRHSYYKHIGLYVYRREFLLTLASLAPTPLEETEQLEQLRALEYGYPIRVVETKYDSIGVDTPEDLERIARIEARNEGG
ncbi:MAG: 3-deoxy-manno-octulosonate cytidylyltransferase [Candidatus Methylomirabilales bacterium]|nr:3-deoxy-manno-octulosonate cytidylyltransferase [candidate division NC10 bacterium]